MNTLEDAYANVELRHDKRRENENKGIQPPTEEEPLWAGSEQRASAGSYAIAIIVH